MEKNLNSFNNPLHHFIWKQIVNLVPLERSTTSSIFDDALKKSCKHMSCSIKKPNAHRKVLYYVILKH